MRIDLTDGYYLSPIRDGDQDAYLEHFADEETTDRLLLVPFPYTKDDAETWVKSRQEAARIEPHETHFALRRADGFLIGGIGLRLNEGPHAAHRAELGYWLARDYRNRGLITTAVGEITRYGFSRLRLTRIEATTCGGNAASQRVLEKARFAFEGVLRGYHRKNGRSIDVRMYACLAPEKPDSSTTSQGAN
jgi:RimJ/RimL family protein N-acetyltransferase